MGIFARHDGEWYRVDGEHGGPVGGGELPGIGGWATITDVKGKGNKYSYTDADGDWVAYEWTADGEVTTQAGLVDVFLIGGGTGDNGNAGDVKDGLRELTGTTHDVVIGLGSQGGHTSGASSCGPILTTIQRYPVGANDSVGAGGTDANRTQGLESSIVGVSRTYGQIGQLVENTGNGGTAGVKGSSGTVIVRVPKDQDHFTDVTGSEAGEPFDIPTTRQAAVAALEEKVEEVKDTMIIDGRERKVKRSRKR